MKKILFVFLLSLSISLVAENNIEPVRLEKRISFFGAFDRVLLDGGGTSNFIGDFLFDIKFYEYMIGLSEKRIPSAFFVYPDPLKDSGLTVGSEYYEHGTWQSKKENNFDYLYLRSNNNYTYKEKLGMLVHPRKLLLFDENYLLFSSDEGLRWSGANPRVVSVRSSSSFVEGIKEYNGQNTVQFSSTDNIPWVEGIDGQGIGEWFEIETETWNWPVDFLLISNGYVDFAKPYLYEYNSRIKKMRIEIEEHDIEFEVELTNTPQFQEIRLPKKIDDGETIIRFTILDVYPGSKWEDTCLNLVIPMGDRP